MSLPATPLETLAQNARSASVDSSKVEASVPTQREIASLVVVSIALFISVVTLAKGYANAVDNFGDSAGYMSVASAIRHWHLRDVGYVEQFWGLPYAIAGLSKLTGLPERVSLLALSLLPSFLSIMIAGRLWNWWVAGYFAVINFDWMQRTCLGGSEPLFVCLVLSAFLAVRRQHWWLATLLAALATTVRPLGIAALAGIGLTLLWKRDFRKFAIALGIGLAIGALYILPFKIYFGDALANVHGYHSDQYRMFGLPFYAIFKGTSLREPWTNLVLSFGWIFFVTGSIVAMVKFPEFRSYARIHLVEAIFLVIYLTSVYTYNYPHWARGNFARFSIPIVPFVLFAFYRWLPKDRRVLWGLGIVSSLLAASSALGIVNVVHMLKQAL